MCQSKTLLTAAQQCRNNLYDKSRKNRSNEVRGRVHSVLEKFLKMLEFGVKTSRPLKVLENR